MGLNRKCKRRRKREHTSKTGMEDPMNVFSLPPKISVQTPLSKHGPSREKTLDCVQSRTFQSVHGPKEETVNGEEGKLTINSW